MDEMDSKMPIKYGDFKEQDGFSLVQVMVAMGIAGLLMVALMRMQQQQAMTSRKATVDIEVNSFQSQMNGLIGRAGYCDKNFLEKSFTGDSIEIDEFLKPNGEPKFVVGETYGDRKFKILSMSLKDFEFDETTGDEDGGAGLANLEIKLERLGKMFGGKFITKNFEVSLYLDQNKVIKGCGSTMTAGLLGGGSGGSGSGMSEKAVTKESVEALVKAQIEAMEESEGKTEDEIKEIQEEKLAEQVNANESLDMSDAKQVQKIIDNNPQLKLLQEQMLNMQKNNKKMEELLNEQ
tara:strand:+ start:37292 stop:38167 length:876 start_codon:yes stop_codon:yes gene_type:complete